MIFFFQVFQIYTEDQCNKMTNVYSRNSIYKGKHLCSNIMFEAGLCTVSLYNTCSILVWPWIWVKAVTSSHECMHHRAGVLIQTPPKKPSPPVRGITGPLRAPGNPFIIHTPVDPDQIQPFYRGERNGNWEAGAPVHASEQWLDV